MSSVYHEGEMAVQRQAGVYEMAQRIGRSIRPTMPGAAQTFLAEQSMVVLGSVDMHGQVWASLLTGTPGFMKALSERTIQIDAFFAPGDLLHDHFQQGSAVNLGLLAIDLATRRRMRVNGMAHVESDGRLLIRTHQVYANCPKYIQARIPDNAVVQDDQVVEVQHTTSLTPSQEHWLASIDTFFIATTHATGGADVSHRGGNPGFVRIIDASTLLFPDYMGNTMFQTLGNIAVNPAAGLVIVDFERGNTLQLTGRAEIIWDERRVAEFVGAQRLVEFHVEKAIERTGILPFRSRMISYSPFNPS